MVTNCVPIVAGIFICYERDSCCLCLIIINLLFYDLLNIGNPGKAHRVFRVFTKYQCC